MPTKTWMQERKQIAFWMEPEDYVTLKDMADKRRLTVAGAVRLAIMELVLHQRAQDAQQGDNGAGERA